jgi:hypothetical protein
MSSHVSASRRHTVADADPILILLQEAATPRPKPQLEGLLRLVGLFGTRAA